MLTIPGIVIVAGFVGAWLGLFSYIIPLNDRTQATFWGFVGSVINGALASITITLAVLGLILGYK